MTKTDDAIRVRVRLMSIIQQANEALMCIGTDKCSENIDDIRTDAQVAQAANDAILMDAHNT